MCTNNQHPQEVERIQKGAHEERYQRNSEDRSGSRMSLGCKSLRHDAVSKRSVQKTTSAAGKKSPVSLSLFMELNNLEIQHELACAALHRVFGSEQFGQGGGKKT